MARSGFVAALAAISAAAAGATAGKQCYDATAVVSVAEMTGSSDDGHQFIVSFIPEDSSYPVRTFYTAEDVRHATGEKYPENMVVPTTGLIYNICVETTTDTGSVDDALFGSDSQTMMAQSAGQSGSTGRTNLEIDFMNARVRGPGGGNSTVAYAANAGEETRGGPRTALLIRVIYTDTRSSRTSRWGQTLPASPLSTEYCDEACMQDMMWDEPGYNIDLYYQKVSFGDVSFDRQTSNVVTVQMGRDVSDFFGCNFDFRYDGNTLIEGLGRKADAILKTMGNVNGKSVDPDDYTHKIYFIPEDDNQINCGFSGVAYVDACNGFSNGYCKSFLNTKSTSSLAHELGHNFGAQHSSTVADDSTTLADLQSQGLSVYACTYCDHSGVMGNGPMVGFTAAHLWHLEWLNDANIFDHPQNCEVTSVELAPLNVAPGSLGANVYSAVRIPRGNGGNYWLAYRSSDTTLDANNFDQFLGSTYANKITIHWEMSHQRPTGYLGAVGADGASFTGTGGNGIGFTVAYQGAGEAAGSVKLGIGFSDCSWVQPTTTPLPNTQVGGDPCTEDPADLAMWSCAGAPCTCATLNLWGYCSPDRTDSTAVMIRGQVCPITCGVCDPSTPDYQCTCSNGNPAIGDACTANGELCTSCDAGYTLSNGQCNLNTCTCNHGIAATGESCPQSSQALCAECSAGYHLENGACVLNTCSCSGGTGATGTACKVDGSETCSDCNAGYHSDGDGCSLNACSCSGGQGATGTSCPTHNGAKCVGCNNARFLDGDACTVKQCTCANGFGASGADCPANGDAQCDTCSAGYHRSGAACVANVCSCPNGQAATGTDCPSPGDVKCTSCESAFFINGDVCSVKECTCENGSGASGAACPNNGDAKCASCSSGHHLDGNACVENVCSCSDGQGAVGADCPSPGDVKCTSCESAFFINGDVCSVKECTCENGSGASGAACPNNGDAKCATCSSGYHSEENGCALNVCTCDNGNGATGAACPTDGNAKCASCSTGFHKESDVCVEDQPNQCACSNGTPKSGDDCSLDGASECASCDTGFHPEGNQCVANVCTCTNGDEATGVSCVSHNVQSCVSCDGGFHPDGEGGCAVNQCTCSGGSAASGADCPRHNGVKCSGCDDGFHPSSGSCVQNLCTCADGVAADGASCTSHNAHICVSCDTGFHPDGSDGCALNQCTCSGGSAAAGPACPKHDAAKCASCDPGFHADGDACAANVCSCPGGTAHSGADCLVDGAVSCSGCGSGHHLTDTGCLPNQCSCANGQGASAQGCPKHAEQLCVSCDSGFTLESSNSCTALAPCVDEFWYCFARGPEAAASFDFLTNYCDTNGGADPSEVAWVREKCKATCDNCPEGTVKQSPSVPRPSVFDSGIATGAPTSPPTNPTTRNRPSPTACAAPLPLAWQWP